MRNIDKITGVLAEDVLARQEVTKAVLGISIPTSSSGSWRGCIKRPNAFWLTDLVARMIEDEESGE